MIPFTRLTALACPLRLENVDTDQLIPARFMKRARSEGYGDVVLNDLRFDEAGAARPDFIMNHARWQGSEILVAGRNFGGGSSREAAVYALVDYGIRCVIAPSIGDIFSSNSVNNGLVPIVLPEEICAEIAAQLTTGSGQLTVDLEACTVAIGNSVHSFAIDPVWRLKLLNGWDDIALTASYGAEIAEFTTRYYTAQPWAQPQPPQG